MAKTKKISVVIAIFGFLTINNSLIAWHADCLCVNSSDESQGSVSVSCDWYGKITESTGAIATQCNQAHSSCNNSCKTPTLGDVLTACTPCVL